MNRKSKNNLKNLILFVVSLIAFACLSLPIQAQKSSKEKSDLVTVRQEILNNCSKAFDELEIADKLIESQTAEIKLLQERIVLEKEKADLMRQIADANKSQADSLSEANNALKEAIAAKDKQIENYQKEVEILKKRKPSLMKRIADVSLGIGLGMILK